MPPPGGTFLRKIILVYFSEDREFTMDKSKVVEAIAIHKVKMFTEKMHVSFYLLHDTIFMRKHDK